MKTFLILVAFVLALVLPGASFAVTPEGWPNTYTPVANGVETWAAPAAAAALVGEAVWSGAASPAGLNGVTAATLKFGGNRSIDLAITRFMSSPSALAAAARVAGTPMGMVLTAAAAAVLVAKVPSFSTWLSGSGNKAQISPTTGVLQKNVGLWRYVTHGFTDTASSTILGSVTLYCSHAGGCPTGYPYHVANIYGYMGPGWMLSSGNSETDSDIVASQIGDSWQDASFDDISPYMTTRPPPSVYPDQVFAAGGTIPVSPVSVTTANAPATPAPYVKTTSWAKPADVNSSVVVPGNPFNLANNMPTVTGSSTGSAPLVGSGATSETGVRPNSLDKPLAIPVTPTQTSTTSTYNPATTQTTSNTVTAQDAAKVVATTTTATTVANTTNSSTINTTYNTTNVTTNTTTNNVTNTTNDVVAGTTPVTQPTDCDKLPSSVGCSDIGVVTDLALPAAPVLYTPKYATGLVGVWNTGKAALLSTPLGSLSAQLMPSGFNSGTCPSWMIPLDLGPWNYGSHDVAPPCWVWDFGKAIIIISALLLARALIFGG